MSEWRQQRVAQARRAVHLRPVVEIADRVHRHFVVLDAPRAGDVEVLEREPERIDDAMARGCSSGCFRCSSMRWRVDRACRPRSPSPIRRAPARPAAAVAAACPSSTSITHLPRRTGDVRSATDVSVRMLPWPSRPRRYSGSVTRRKAAPVTFGNAVMLRQPLVHEGVVGRQQIEHAAIVADDAVEEELGFTPHRVLERVVELRVLVEVGLQLVEILQPQPLAREARGRAPRSARRRACAAPASRAPAALRKQAGCPPP